MPARPVHNIDKVTHKTVVEYSVVKIAANTGSEESKSNVNQFLLSSAQKENRKDYYQSNH